MERGQELERRLAEVRGALHDEGPGAPARGDDAHRLQRAQPRPQRRSAHAHLQGELALGGESVAGAEAPASISRRTCSTTWAPAAVSAAGGLVRPFGLPLPRRHDEYHPGSSSSTPLVTPVGPKASGVTSPCARHPLRTLEQPRRSTGRSGLEDELHPDLGAPGVVGLVGGRDLPEGGGRRADDRVREVGLVEGVDELGPQLEPDVSLELDVLDERQVDVVDGVPADVVEPVRERPQVVDRRRVRRRVVQDRREGVGVEPPLDGRVAIAMSPPL